MAKKSGSRNKTNVITVSLLSVLLLVVIGVSLYFIITNERKKKKHHHHYPPPPPPPYHGKCNHSAGYVWSKRLGKCVKGYGN